jgi:hypothetical protein
MRSRTAARSATATSALVDVHDERHGHPPCVHGRAAYFPRALGINNANVTATAKAVAVPLGSAWGAAPYRFHGANNGSITGEFVKVAWQGTGAGSSPGPYSATTSQHVG